MEADVNVTANPVVTFTVDQLARDHPRRDATSDLALRTWLVGYGLARPNGHPGVLELTDRGAQAAADVAKLLDWIRT